MKALSVVCLSTSPPTATQSKECLRRRFEFVEYGASVTEDSSSTPTISCDGRIPGVTLELTHWNGNETPEKYYADTSTEMALRLPTNIFQEARILNNHFDTDGALSVFACLQPDLAQHYAPLLMEGAAAGDFGEWSSDRGIQLDATLEALCQQECGGDDAIAYQRALEELPKLLHDLTHNQGAGYETLWKPALDHAYQSKESLEKSDSTLELLPSGMIISVERASGSGQGGDDDDESTGNAQPESWLSSFALHRALVERGWWDTTNRILRAMPVRQSNMFHYRYEKPGHGWVQKLTTRRPIPPVSTDLQTHMVEALEKQQEEPTNRIGDQSSEEFQRKGTVPFWKKGGPSLVTICSTSSPIHVTPAQVAKLLIEMESDESVF
ncbi:hypothetical protein ACA910_004366 [Epithemia clementina (nom. ined.)]